MARKNGKGVAQAEETKVEETTAEQVEETAAEQVEAGVSDLANQLQQANAQPTETKAEPVEKNAGVGSFIKRLINEGLPNKEILKIVHEQYGNTNTTYACVAWYRNKMKKAGVDVKKLSALEWVKNFAEKNNLGEEAVEELTARLV